MKDTFELPESVGRDGQRQRTTRSPKPQRVNELTGAFVLVIMLLLIGTVVWTGRSQRWFKSNVSLRILLPEAGAAGIRQGSEVYFLGTRVGTVSDVVLDKTGRIEAQASIRHDFFLFVCTDSTAVVKKKFGVAGDSFFEISRGKGRPLPEKDASVVCNEQFQSALEAAVEDVHREAILVLKKVNGGLDAWTALGTNLVTTQQRLDQLVGRIDSLASEVQAGKGTVGNLLKDSGSSDELKQLLVKASRSIDEFRVTLTNLQQASANLPAITDAIRQEAKDLPGLVLQTKTSMREVERLVEALQQNWFVRKHINKTNPPSLNPAVEEPLPEKKPVQSLHSPRNSPN